MRFGVTLCSCALILGCSHTRTTSGTASPVSVAPSSGKGSAQIFTATYKNPNGGSKIAEATLLIMSNNVLPGSISKWSANACLIRYDIATNAIWLVSNVGGTWGHRSIAAGSSATLSNSQCTVMASGSSAQVSGTTLTVKFDVTFPAEFAGTKQLYLGSEDANGNWSANNQQQFGSFTVTDAMSPLSHQ